jgi:aminoglycoside phosphotransferase (APT) family kinase protein
MTVMIDRQRTFSGTRPVETSAGIDIERLGHYLGTVLSGFELPITLEQFKGGQSNPTYKITTQNSHFVLRRKPPGKLLPSAHAVDREFRVIDALSRARFPVARPLHFCADETIIGSAFYVMDYVPGRIFWEPHAPGLSESDRRQLFDHLNETIARLHDIDFTAAGLGNFGKGEGYMLRQVRRWTEQYRASKTAEIPEMEKLIEWLPAALPPQNETKLIHGDFRLDNCIIDAMEPRIIAVLDWELSTLGDPLADFTYHLTQWHMPLSASGAGVGSLKGRSAPGIPELNDYITSYCARRGFRSIERMETYLAFNFFRLAAIFQGIAGRLRDGTATSPEAALMGEEVATMAKTAWRFAKEAGA